MRLDGESSSSFRAKDEVSAIGADTAATPTIRPASQVAKQAQIGIVIREPVPEEEPTQEKVPKGKGKKRVKEALGTPSRDSTPFHLRRARREVEENKLKEEAWLQR